ncbi:hypothetical protein VTH82DRAFT_5468 [Thermothelomyces myriococcoides]
MAPGTVNGLNDRPVRGIGIWLETPENIDAGPATIFIISPTSPWAVLDNDSLMENFVLYHPPWSLTRAHCMLGYGLGDHWHWLDNLEDDNVHGLARVTFGRN